MDRTCLTRSLWFFLPIPVAVHKRQCNFEIFVLNVGGTKMLRKENLYANSYFKSPFYLRFGLASGHPRLVRPRSNGVLHMSRIECLWTLMRENKGFSHLHSIRLMRSKPFEPGLRGVSTRVSCICLDFRDLTQNTTATATGTSPNKRFTEQNNGCARAF